MKEVDCKMLMCLKKKKHILFLTLCMVLCFILYQLYFFKTITSETIDGNSIELIAEFKSLGEKAHVHSKADQFINHHGVVKGVLPKYMVKYRPDYKNEFKCLNSGEHISFDKVNDDYCDCEDGTDEPSTSACPQGIFFCDTQHSKKQETLLTVPSSQVNDGICDCCDGSDEWILYQNIRWLSQSENHIRHYVTLCSNTCY